MAYKVFSNGDALTGSELNTYLMNQSVMVFASTSARDAALTTPSEGMIVWLQDSDKYVYYTGSAWSNLITPPSSSGNAIINGAFEINQRNFSSSTADSGYNFDRWNYYRANGSATVSSESFTLGAEALPSFGATKFVQCAVTGGSSANDMFTYYQPIENVRTFAGQQVTVSFYAKSASGTPKVGVSMEQYFGSGGSSTVYTGSTVTLSGSTTWTRYSATVTIPSVSGKTIGSGDNLKLNFILSAGTSIDTLFGTSVGVQTATIGIWGVQVESGSTATAFKRNASNIQGELAACQRYYVRFRAPSGSYAAYSQATAVQSSTVANPGIIFPVEMRTSPTSIDYAGTNYLSPYPGGSAYTVTSMTLATAGSSKNVGQVAATIGTSSMSTSTRYDFIAGGTGNDYLGFSAEL